MILSSYFNLQTRTIIIATISIGYSLLCVIGTVQTWAYPDFIEEKINIVEINRDINVHCHSSRLANFPFFFPLVFPIIFGDVFIILYMFSSGLLLRGAILCEKFSIAPWLCLTSFSIILHVGSAIIESAVFFSTNCIIPGEEGSLIGLLIICIVEIYFIATVYFFYSGLDDDTIQWNDLFFSFQQHECHHNCPPPNQPNREIQIVSDILAPSSPPSVVINELPPSYDQIMPSSPNNPPLYVEAIARMKTLQNKPD